MLRLFLLSPKFSLRCDFRGPHFAGSSPIEQKKREVKYHSSFFLVLMAGLPSAAATPCILPARDRCFATVPARTLVLKTIHRIVLLTHQAQWLQVRPLLQEKEKQKTLLFFLVLMAGLEPARYCYRGILSPLRLPISPHQHIKK